MATWMFAGHLLMGSAQLATYIYRLIRPHKISILGPSLAGKTTLDQYLTVPGDIDPIPLEMRTTHPVKNGSFQMPHATKKQVRWKGEKTPIMTADIGGQSQYWNMWAEDMIERKTSVIFFVVDDRVAWSHPAMQVAVAGYVVDERFSKIMGHGVEASTPYGKTISRRHEAFEAFGSSHKC
jgi:hypothetical protein